MIIVFNIGYYYEYKLITDIKIINNFIFIYDIIFIIMLCSITTDRVLILGKSKPLYFM